MKNVNKEGFPILDSLNLVLKIPDDKDIPEMISFFNRNGAHLKSTSPLRSNDFNISVYWTKILEQNRRDFLQGVSVNLFVYFKHENSLKIMGEVNFYQIFKGVFLAYKLGYKIDLDYQGKGLMKEAREY